MNANMFTRARLNLPLSPGERAFLRFLPGVGWSALFTAITAVLPLVEQQSVNWHTVITVGVGTLATTLAYTIQHYFTSQGDTIAAGITGDVGTVVGQKTGVTPTVNISAVPNLDGGVPAAQVAPVTQ
jgi:hypothetical protein